MENSPSAASKRLDPVVVEQACLRQLAYEDWRDARLPEAEIVAAILNEAQFDFDMGPVDRNDPARVERMCFRQLFLEGRLGTGLR